MKIAQSFSLVLAFTVFFSCSDTKTKDSSNPNASSAPKVDTTKIVSDKVQEIDKQTKEVEKVEIVKSFDLSNLKIGEEFKGGIVIKQNSNEVLVCTRKPLGAGSYSKCVELCRKCKTGSLKWRIPSPKELELIFRLRNYLDSYELNWYWTNNTSGNMAEHIGIQAGDHMFVPKEHGKFVIAVAKYETE
jgi:hypothetical protein